MTAEKTMRGRCFGSGQFNWNISEDLEKELERLSDLSLAINEEYELIMRHLDKLRGQK